MVNVNEIKLSAVVVTYYPVLSDAIINIKQYIEHVDKLIIWENTPIIDRELHKIILPEYSDKIIYLGTDKNEGMAFALNRSVEWSIKNGYTHILTMDQDSFWIDFKHYRNKIVEYCIDTSIGIFGPNVYTMMERRNFSKNQFAKDTITSGSVFSIDMLAKIGLFREDFFIDAVDLEYCYWAQRNGFKTIVFQDCHLKQKFGNTTTHLFFNKAISTSHYSAFRLFHIVRNHIFLWREYPELSKIQKKQILTEYTLLRIVKILLYEKGKTQKIVSIIRGTINGLFCIGENPRNKLTKCEKT